MPHHPTPINQSQWTSTNLASQIEEEGTIEDMQCKVQVIPPLLGYASNATNPDTLREIALKGGHKTEQQIGPQAHKA